MLPSLLRSNLIPLSSQALDGVVLGRTPHRKLRWAQGIGKSAPKKDAAPAKKAPARKPMSPAARKKLSALAKARWAAAKKSGAKTL